MKPEVSEFFVVSLPGLEDLVVEEIRSWFPHLEVQQEHGGVTVWAPMAEGLGLNLVLKSGVRVLLRLHSFRCRDFPKLFKTFRDLPWNQWVQPDTSLVVNASSRASRLKIKKRIEETCLKAYEKARINKGDGTATVYVRFLNDQCTISLDTTGERLHKRGHRQLIGEAPLRENLAAAMILMVMKHANVNDPVEIIDPMMGSGTFLLEATGLHHVAPQREFAFKRIPQVKAALPKAKPPKLRIERLVGFERDPKTFEAARKNLKDVQDVQLYQADFFSTEPMANTQARRWVFCNPPYGERIRVEDDLKKYYETLFETTERVVKPDYACFLLPTGKVKGKFKLPVLWKIVDKRPFLHGGLPVTAFLFQSTRSAKPPGC